MITVESKTIETVIQREILWCESYPYMQLITLKLLIEQNKSEKCTIKNAISTVKMNTYMDLFLSRPSYKEKQTTNCENIN